MSVVVVVGAQWGDEGKGKIVDIYTQHADMVVRYAGGANAGHTLVVEGEKLILHLIPSGVLHKRPRIVLGQGTVIDPRVLCEEIELLKDRCALTPERLLVSDRAHLVLPQHIEVDGLREQGAKAIGTTKRGIGPAYQDKTARRGLRIADLLHPERFREKVAANLDAWEPIGRALGGRLPSVEDVAIPYLALGKKLAPYVGNASRVVDQGIKRGDHVLMEGAQGTMLDLDHGTYPFVTSSSAVSAGAALGAGVGPTAIDKVIGITKAYTTRVGAGPFPTELHGAEGDALRQAGQEFGATTGRPRRCGWLDLVALRYAVRLNGMDALAMTKLDVLSGMDQLQICTAYELDGEQLDEPPMDAEDLARVQPVYETIDGWSEPLTGAKTIADLPAAARRYIERIESLVECPARLISVGPDRDETLALDNPFAE